MTRTRTRKRVRRYNVAEPKNESQRFALCGYDQRRSEEYWAKRGGEHSTFFLAQQTTAPKDTVRIWDTFRKVTGEDPDTTPQPTGDCVAAAVADVVEGTQANEILAGDAEEFREIYKPFHYATGRVLVMKNSLKGEAGASGGAVAEAVKRYGVIQIAKDLPDYTKGNVDAWGDDRKAGGKSFRDYLEDGAKTVIQSTARITSIGHVLEALDSNYLLTIASNRGYTMKPDRDGYHRASGSWSHQMSIWGYSISKNWIAIKNQWGDLFGDLFDFETEEEWPIGFLRVRLDEFEAKHFAGSETIVYSRFQGFPQQRFDHRLLS